LIKSGALDQLYNRATLWHNIKRILDWVKASEQQTKNGGGLFAMDEVQ
jgi:DNA polymerase III alpha subunit